MSTQPQIDALIDNILSEKSQQAMKRFAKDGESTRDWMGSFFDRMTTFMRTLRECDYRYFKADGLQSHLNEIKTISELVDQVSGEYENIGRVPEDRARTIINTLVQGFGGLYTALAPFVMYAVFATGKPIRKLDEIQKLIEENQTQVNSARQAVNEFTAAYKQKMAQTEEAVRQAVEINRAHSYWIQKAKGHSGTIKNMVAAIAATVIASTLLIVPLALKSSDYHEQMIALNKPFWATFQPSSVIFLFLVLFVTTWILRILVRLTLVSLHQRNDAHERAVVIKTYLSLLMDAKALKDGERQIMLQTIFRPSPINMEQGDFAPDTGITTLQNMVPK